MGVLELGVLEFARPGTGRGDHPSKTLGACPSLRKSKIPNVGLVTIEETAVHEHHQPVVQLPQGVEREVLGVAKAKTLFKDESYRTCDCGPTVFFSRKRLPPAPISASTNSRT